MAFNADNNFVMGLTGTIRKQRRVMFLPVNPEQIQTNMSRSIQLTELVGARQMSNVGGDRLERIEFTSIYPSTDDIYNVGENYGIGSGKSPQDFINFIRALNRVREPLDFFIWADFNEELDTAPVRHQWKVAIANFTFRYRGGFGTGIEYDIVLQETRKPIVRPISLDAVEALPGSGASPLAEDERSDIDVDEVIDIGDVTPNGTGEEIPRAIQQSGQEFMNNNNQSFNEGRIYLSLKNAIDSSNPDVVIYGWGQLLKSSRDNQLSFGTREKLSQLIKEKSGNSDFVWDLNANIQLARFNHKRYFTGRGNDQDLFIER